MGNIEGPLLYYAFSSVKWDDILDASRNTFQVLLCVLEDYARLVKLLYNTRAGFRKKKITTGVAQG